MGHGKSSGGTLPVEGRPEEWNKWYSKNWHGTRRWDLAPDIEDPADAGIAMTKWWSTLQPAFRKSDDAFPLAVYSDPSAGQSDPWVVLHKSGHKGFVTVLMIMAWWGHAAISRTSEWQVDSRPAWNYLISDILGVLKALTLTTDSPLKEQGNVSVQDETPIERGANKENEAPVQTQASRKGGKRVADKTKTASTQRKRRRI
ncbi:hypothetical protein NMY22_g1056 [Coprinellus aureogranulatus]|nr:hypothetical protein NMY22_g1056 [Coprinellus aureogranulatus]